MKINGETLYIGFHQVLFLLTGLSITLGTQWIFYHGAATGDSYLAQLAQYIGMVLVGCLIPILLRNKQKGYSKLDQEEAGADIHMVQVHGSEITDDPISTESHYLEGTVSQKSVIKLALIDILANFCVTVGFSIVGSGMYQVIYSSVVIWCAILTFFLMKRDLSKLQWLSIFGTSAGLALSSLGNFSTSSEPSAKASTLMFGTIMTLAGTFGYSCVYVYSDYIMSQTKPPPLPARVCFYSGCYTALMSLVWISIYTLPRFDELIHIKEGTTIQTVLLMYAMVALSNTCHSWNYYELIDRTGSVATGILQGLRAVLIYIISDAWYCKTDTAQCFTKFKGIGSILVIGCVILFTLGRSKSPEKKVG